MRSLRERGIREGLVRRCEDLFRETKCRVRAEISEVFWTSKGIRKRCPMIGEFKIVQYVDNGVGREKEDKERLKEGKMCH